MPSTDLARRISQVADILKDANTRLARINSEWADPPEPDKPEIRTALNDIKNQAVVSTRLADGMLGRLV